MEILLLHLIISTRNRIGEKYMYKKSVQGWLKHLDFMILDVVCLWISFTLAFNMRHGSLDVLANSLYRDMMWSLALMDIVVIFFFDSLKNVLKRGFYQEFVMTVKQTCLITLCSVFYLFTFKEAENYSRLVLGYTAALYLLISYVLRCLWKNCLRKYFGGAEKRSLLIVTVSDIVDTVIDNIKIRITAITSLQEYVSWIKRQKAASSMV